MAVSAVQFTETLEQGRQKWNANDSELEGRVDSLSSSLENFSLGGGIFITDVQPSTTGIVNLTYLANTSPSNKVITQIESNTNDVDVTIECDGSADNWQPPIVNVNGDPVIISQIATNLRRFSGTINNVDISASSLTAGTSEGSTAALTVLLQGGGPSITNFTLGDYPGTQTELKEDDRVLVTGQISVTSGQVQLLNYGIFKESSWIDVEADGTFSFSGYVSDRTGTLSAQLRSRNDFGTIGTTSTSTASMILNQTVPTFTFNGITYPVTQSALKDNEQATVDLECNNYSSVSYISPNSELSIDGPTVYQQEKTCNRIAGSYNDSSINFRLIAQRAANNTSATSEQIVYIANVAPNVSVLEPYTSLRSGTGGENYTVSILSDQNLTSAPTLSASAGTLGLFTGSNKNWSASITIEDDDLKGTHNWTNLYAINGAGISTTTIQGNDTYNILGFTTRRIVFPAFDDMEPIGTYVSNTANLSAIDIGGYTFNYQNSFDNNSLTFTITNASRSLSANGNYIVVTDQNWVSQNSTGTAFIDLEETI